MIHQAQEGTPISDILLGLAVALVRNYASTLIKGDTPAPLVSLQGGVMSNQAVVHAFREALQLRPEQIVVPPVRLQAHSIREVQVLFRYTLQPVANCNCVAVKRGGEQQEVNDQSVG